ncbi:glycosyltransferase [Lysobacter changpingensis]|jgi:GT2 family glycosyltransferase/glycosyltransferase involved in cell wall biosynthesis|uniref:glycosyltransferase n=1 Tax=Lysobacter changpingensis TaxID=2792784 RepID=UPI001A8C818D|nr:glycosyltransferase [Lysobacter changpingensis]
MGLSWTELRFFYDRGTGLVRRGLASVRTRGVRASWERVLKQFHTVPMEQRLALYLPQAEPFAPFAVPHAQRPKASIVIPVYNQFAHTLACLRAIAAHPPSAPIEIIVSDDGSSDETADALAQVEGVRYHRRARNGGFIAACNDGAMQARGEFLVFLNNDTIPQPGWLDTLLATFDSGPDIGLAGAQLVYPDGRLQEAGGLVFSDGSAHNYGRFESPNDPRYGFVRDADYCSGAALAMPRALFESVGGFDRRYEPAYFEDTDMAFAVRAKGLRVVYQPHAHVVHMEGTTAGVDDTKGVKAYQARNRHVFAEKWHEALQHQPPPQTTPYLAAGAGAARRVLIVDGATPQPDRDSASLRLVNLMRLLREEQAQVAFFPGDLSHAGDNTRRLQSLGVEAWYAPFATTPAQWMRTHGRAFDTIVICRHYVLREWLPLVRRFAPQAKLVFDTVDLHYLRERRGAELAGDVARKRASERTRTLELEMIARSDATLVVSEVERTLLAQDAPGARVEIVSNLHHVRGRGLPFEQRHDLVFVGGFRHPPNVDAVQWFVGDVFPIVRAQLPEVRFHCIGSDTPPEIAALAARPGVVVHGYVPDIDPYMDGARIAVAPLRYGAGVKGKVNLSMAHGQPVVATACAVEGMHLRDGEDVLVGNDPEAFAQAVVRLYTDAALWNRLSRSGLANVERHFSLDAARDVVRRVLLERD